jgi:hypothetical protein
MILLVFLVYIGVAVVGHLVVVWTGNLTGHYFARNAPREWEQDNLYGPLPDGSFRCHRFAGCGVVPRWVSIIQVIGFLLRVAGAVSFVITLIGWLLFVVL